MKSKHFLPLLLAGCISTYTVMANNNDGEKAPCEGVVQGYVIDANTKKPVAGVVISATSTKNPNDRKEVLTDGTGYYKFPELPAGEVKFRFEKKGYRQQKKDAVAVKEGMVVKMNIEIVNYKADVEDYEHPFFRLDIGF